MASRMRSKLRRCFGSLRLGSSLMYAAYPRAVRIRTVCAERMAQWVPRLGGAQYDWVRELGGFRKARPDSPNVALRHPSFQGYADYMQTREFLSALDALLERSAAVPAAIMCSESLWWRCHRRLIADAMTLLHGVDVQHILHSGRLESHRLTDGVRVTTGGIVQYDQSLNV
jgi:uncharacterized protein (DUF488 family)